MDIDKSRRICRLLSFGPISAYSGSRIAANRRLTLKWPFPQEKATFDETQKVYMYSGTALNTRAPMKAAHPLGHVRH
jgi:hypothetical protein